MRFPEPLIPGTLIRRYKRFLADIQLESGAVVVAHCPNPGRMTGLLEVGSNVLVSESNNPRRKLAYTWELLQANKVWVVVNTMRTNAIVADAIRQGEIPALGNYTDLKTEPQWQSGSRFDILLQRNVDERCYVEVKNVTLVEKDVALFPDAVTLRGTKHLRKLIEVVERGYRGVIFFLVNRGDAVVFRPASHIDPGFAEALREAAAAGVEVLVYRTRIKPPHVSIDRLLPFEL